jgi:hypothetical protein
VYGALEEVGEAVPFRTRIVVGPVPNGQFVLLLSRRLLLLLLLLRRRRRRRIVR